MWSPFLKKIKICETMTIFSKYFGFISLESVTPIFSFLFLVSLQRAPSLPISRPPSSSRSRFPSPPVTSAGFGKRPAPGVSFIKAKQKRKQANLVKDFIFSSVDEEGQMVMLFPISINFTEVLERFGQLSVSIVGSAIEQELRDQGEVVRLCHC